MFKLSLDRATKIKEHVAPLVKKWEVCHFVIRQIGWKIRNSHSTSIEDFFPVVVMQLQTADHIASNALTEVFFRKILCRFPGIIDIGAHGTFKLRSSDPWAIFQKSPKIALTHRCHYKNKKANRMCTIANINGTICKLKVPLGQTHDEGWSQTTFRYLRKIWENSQ